MYILNYMREPQVLHFYKTSQMVLSQQLFLTLLDKSVEFFGDLDIPNFYNEAEIDAIGDELSALILNTYTKTKVEALIYNTNLVDHYTKTEADTQLTNYTTITYLQGNYVTTLAITETLMNNLPLITFIQKLKLIQHQVIT